MRSAEFNHGPYTIKTFVLQGECRARAFLNGTWLRNISDWKAETLEEVVQRMRASLDAEENDEEEDTEIVYRLLSAPFLSHEV
ncbi:hypothetical protein [Teichococcus vastitatis]|uniref:hypothetical protein n=1 Tax=Teichococcus vastitatis TaxID=2307076 RepID=UPI001300B8C1|nr:hypothetical protein [Pseudoroseomonas vastitatis]